MNIICHITKQNTPQTQKLSSFCHSVMSSPLSLSSLFPFPSPLNSLSRHRHTTRSPHRKTLTFSSSSTPPPPLPSPPDNQPPRIAITPPPSPETIPAPDPDRKSLAVATGELFLGIASRLINLRRRGGDNGNGRVEIEEEEVVWEQREKDVEAERKRMSVVTRTGFSFSAAGLLFPYHLGVAQFLLEKGYIKETTPLAGSSAGAIVCAVIASGASMQEALEATKILAEDCRSKGTAFRLGAVLREVLQTFLPEDVHIRSSGRVRVAVTQILWRPRALLIDQFDSKDDLINAVFTSSFIPGYLAPRPATMFRNRLCVDGGLTLFMPPTSAPETVRICAFPTSQLGLKEIGISPDCNPENRLSSRQLFNWALEPAADNVLDGLFELGYLDASVWAQSNPVDEIVAEERPIDGNGSAL